jgi:hypothetical protein
MSSSLSEKLLKVCDYINANRVHQNISPDDGKLRIRSTLIEPPDGCTTAFGSIPTLLCREQRQDAMMNREGPESKSSSGTCQGKGTSRSVLLD